MLMKYNFLNKFIISALGLGLSYSHVQNAKAFDGPSEDSSPTFRQRRSSPPFRVVGKENSDLSPCCSPNRSGSVYGNTLNATSPVRDFNGRKSPLANNTGRSGFPDLFSPFSPPTPSTTVFERSAELLEAGCTAPFGRLAARFGEPSVVSVASSSSLGSKRPFCLDQLAVVPQHPNSLPPSLNFAELAASSQVGERIESERLRMRPVRLGDRENYSLPFKDKRAMTYWMQGREREDTEIKEWFEEDCHAALNTPFARYFVFTKEGENFVGFVDIKQGDEVRNNDSDLEMTYLLMPLQQHKGYGREAVWRMLGFIRELRAKGMRMPNGHIPQTVVATIHPDNAPSAHLAEKCGFSKTIRILRYGNPRDVYGLALYKS